MITVSIIGPPNAGKSTLYNRFLRSSPFRPRALMSETRHTRRKSGQIGSAIVSSVSGTTRDRRECIGGLADTSFRLYDTAGVDNDVMSVSGIASPRGHKNRGNFKRRKKVSMSDIEASNITREEIVLEGMARQTLAAAAAADVILLLFDARSILEGGSNVEIVEMGRWLRKNLDKNANARVVLCANKLEGDRFTMADDDSKASFEETEQLGFGEPVLISAEHGDGMADLAVIFEEATAEKIEEIGHIPPPPSDSAGINLAILGRQNVGKSTLLNALVKDDRVITGSFAGLTRDAINVDFSVDGQLYSIVDTAGVRKETKRDKSNEIENESVRDAMRALKTAHVCALVVDAEGENLSRVELGIADAVIREGRALIIVANKADLLVEKYGLAPMKYAEQVKAQVDECLPHIGDVLVVPTSAIDGHGGGVENVLPTVKRVFDRWNTRISTGALNTWFKEILFSHPPPSVGGRNCKMKYIVQAKSRPPTFMISVNCAEKDIEDSYVRYIRNSMREAFNMEGMSIRIKFQSTRETNPYAGKKRKGNAGTGAGKRGERRDFAQGSIGRVRYKQIREESKKNKKKDKGE